MELVRTSELPVLPEPGQLVSSQDVVELEGHLASVIQMIDAMPALIEAQRRAQALEQYLRSREGHPAAQGIARRIEARIGQLLGPGPGRGRKEMSQHADSFHRETRRQFRALAELVERGLLDYEDEEGWRASRRAMLLAATVRSLGGLKQSVTVEWYTPAKYIEAARSVLGHIDLDPASSPLANETVRADQIYTEEDDGLNQEWYGRIWLNPPYGKLTGPFVSKLVEEHEAGRVKAAILLINAYGFDSAWFQPLWNYTLCFTNHRISFWSPQRGSGGPANANLFVYLGNDKGRFADVFSEFGAIVERIA
jgi:hypothetical protein